jgi:hypothetical protein
VWPYLNKDKGNKVWSHCIRYRNVGNEVKVNFIKSSHLLYEQPYRIDVKKWMLIQYKAELRWLVADFIILIKLDRPYVDYYYEK